MTSTKLLELLKNLDAAEFRRFHQFLQSPYYNYNRHVIDLYNYLRKYHPDFVSPRLTKEKVFQKLFPGEAFNLNKMRKLMSALTQLAEEYLLTLELKSNIYQKKKLLAGVYRRRNLGKRYQKSASELIETLHESPYRNQVYYLELMQLNQDLYFHPATNKQRRGTKLLDQAMENLDSFYLLSKLQLGAEIKTRENILAEKHSVRLLAESIRLSRQSFVSKNPLYLVYLQILDLHQNADGIEVFLSATTLFRKIIAKINRRERQIILHHLLNHCIRLINEGKTQYRKELFELYQLGVEHDLLVENDQITEVTFSNIVAIGASLEAFDWVGIFIDRYAAYLKEEVRQDTKALCLALWHFNKKAYDLAAEALLTHTFSNMLNLLKSRCLLIRIYFEHFLLDDAYYIFLIDQANAFEKFIRRHNKIAVGKSAAYLNFIKFTKKLALCKDNNKDLAEFRQKLNGQTPITYKGWLLEKVETMS